MNSSDSIAIARAKESFDRAKGAADGADYTGFLLALLVAFCVPELWTRTMTQSILLRFVVGMTVLFCIRLYYGRALRAAEDTYHRLAAIGKYQ